MSNTKAWRLWPHDECLHCGSAVEVFTDAPEEMLTEDDEARCVECGCPGTVGIQDGGPDDCDDVAYINWHDEPDCDCEWCKAHPAE